MRSKKIKEVLNVVGVGVIFTIRLEVWIGGMVERII